jgi:hypothetical protein
VALDALTRFEGVKRRLELRGTVRGVAVYDDFAHHPTAITLTVEGPAPPGGEARILGGAGAPLQHHEAGRDEGPVAGSLTQADKVFCYAANLGWDADPFGQKQGYVRKPRQRRAGRRATGARGKRWHDNQTTMATSDFRGSVARGCC